MNLSDLATVEAEYYGFKIIKRSEIPADAVESTDKQWRHELQKQFRTERPEFNRLKRLAQALGVSRVVVSPEPATTDLLGCYNSFWDVGTKMAAEWGLSERQRISINRSMEVGR